MEIKHQTIGTLPITIRRPRRWHYPWLKWIVLAGLSGSLASCSWW